METSDAKEQKKDTPTKPSYKCFAIMPFSETTHTNDRVTKTITEAEWTNIFTDWIKKAVESFANANINCIRSATAPGNFVKGIVGAIKDANFVIADLTGSKPNVYYELGIRHALRPGTIIITQHLDALPSDLKSYHCFEYSYYSEHHKYISEFPTFLTDLHKNIQSILDSNFASDSPVSDFLGFEGYKFAQEWERQRDELVELMRDYILAYEEVSSSTFMRDFQNNPIDLFRTESIATQFFNRKWTVFNPEFIRQIQNEIIESRKGLVAMRDGSLRPVKEEEVEEGYVYIPFATSGPNLEIYIDAALTMPPPGGH